MKRGTYRKTIRTKSGVRSIAVEKRVIASKQVEKSEVEFETSGTRPYMGAIAAEVSSALRGSMRFPRPWWEV